MLAVNVTCLVWMILPLLQLKCVCICVCSAAGWYLLLKDLSDYFRLFKLNLIYCLLLHVLVGFLLNVCNCLLLLLSVKQALQNIHINAFLLFTSVCCWKNHFYDGKQILHSSKTNGKNFLCLFFSFFHFLFTVKLKH